MTREPDDERVRAAIARYQEDHHGSHRRLLTRVGPVGREERLDAIVVPSARPASALLPIIELARGAGCALLVLCSGRSRAGEVAALAERSPDVTAVDIAGLGRLLPSFETSALHRGTKLPQTGDTSLKRNVALLVARLAGWRRVMYLDDDIKVNAADLGTAAAVLDHVDAVGLDNLGFEDNSVVCHAYRLIGGSQDTFIGGGAMLIRPAATTSFFPEIYNEDWLFLLKNTSLGSVASHGTMHQEDYDPFDDPARAAGQEFGDCIAEGIYWLLDQGSQIRHADSHHWRISLGRRRSLIDRIRRRMVNAPTPRDTRRRVLASLEAALDAHRHITPRLCTDYLQAWHRDRAAWRRHLRDHRASPFPRPVAQVFRDLGVAVNSDRRPAVPRLSSGHRSSTVDTCASRSDRLSITITPHSYDNSGQRSFSANALIPS